MDRLAGESNTDATGRRNTVICEPALLPSTVAVMVTGPPAAMPVTRPDAETEASAGVPDDQLMARPDKTAPLASSGIAANCVVAPTSTAALVGEIVTDATTGVSVPGPVASGVHAVIIPKEPASTSA
jgi:hypothetical protein